MSCFLKSSSFFFFSANRFARVTQVRSGAGAAGLSGFSIHLTGADASISSGDCFSAQPKISRHGSRATITQQNLLSFETPMNERSPAR
jgi:hypothetical protein